MRLGTCGTDGPVRVLEHAPDVVSRVEAWGELLLVHTTPVAQLGAENPLAGTEAWVVGACGESPARIAVGRAVTPIGDWLLACEPGSDGKHEVLRIDPTGQADPVVLFERSSCSFVVTEHGLLTFDAEQGLLLRHLDPTRDDLTAEVLAADVAEVDGLCFIGVGMCDETNTSLAGSAFFVVTRAHELVRIDLAMGRSSVMATSAAWGWVTPDGSRLWWQELALDAAGEPDPFAPVHLRDLATNEDRQAYEGTAPQQRQWPYGLARLRNATDPALLDLRDGTLRSLPPRIRSIGTRPGAPLILFGTFTEGVDISYAWLEAEARIVELATARPCGPYEHGPQGLDQLWLDDCADSKGDLWSYPYEGGGPLRVAEDVIGGAFLHFEDRVVWSNQSSPLGDSGVSVGDLFATDPDDGRILLDERARYLPWPWKDLDGDALYGVHDGERSGVWRTATR